MPADLRTRIIANAYRLTGASPADDHLAIRKAAERSAARARVGAPLRVTDGYPEIPAGVQTEAAIQGALSRLLVPVSRLEERALSFPVSTHPLAARHAAALQAVLDGEGAGARTAWRALLCNDAFWRYLRDCDAALPRAQEGDAARLRQGLPHVLAAGMGAAVIASLARGEYEAAAKLHAFLMPEVWTASVVEPARAAVWQAAEQQIKALELRLHASPVEVAMFSAAGEAVALWACLAQMGPLGGLAGPREGTAALVMRALERAAGDPRWRDLIAQTMTTAEPLLCASRMQGRFLRLAADLKKPAAAQPTTKPAPAQSTTAVEPADAPEVEAAANPPGVNWRLFWQRVLDYDQWPWPLQLAGTIVMLGAMPFLPAAAMGGYVSFHVGEFVIASFCRVHPRVNAACCFVFDLGESFGLPYVTKGLVGAGVVIGSIAGWIYATEPAHRHGEYAVVAGPNADATSDPAPFAVRPPLRGDDADGDTGGAYAEAEDDEREINRAEVERQAYRNAARNRRAAILAEEEAEEEREEAERLAEEEREEAALLAEAERLAVEEHTGFEAGEGYEESAW